MACGGREGDPAADVQAAEPLVHLGAVIAVAAQVRYPGPFQFRQEPREDRFGPG